MSETPPLIARYSPELLDLLREAASRSGTVRLQVQGFSMTPTIRDGEVVHVRPASIHDLHHGDIALVEIDGIIRAHRVREVIPGPDPALITRGDAVPQDDPPVTHQHVLGRVDAVERGGTLVPLRGQAPPAPRKLVTTSERIRTLPLRALLRCLRSTHAGRQLLKRLRSPQAVVRDATLADVPSIAALLASFHPNLPPETLYLSTERELRCATDLGAYYLVADVRGRVVGNVKGGALMQTVGDFPGWWVVGLHVHTLYRGLGIGEQLVRELLCRAANDGVQEVFCHIAADNTPSLKLFAKLGFTQASWELERKLNQHYETARRRCPPIKAFRLVLSEDTRGAPDTVRPG
ncbi:MAG: GNAT family N-acetyltransferase [Armatimonadota bacterium]